MTHKGVSFSKSVDDITEKVTSLKDPIMSLLKSAEEEDPYKTTKKDIDRAVRKLHQLLSQVSKLEATMQTLLRVVEEERGCQQQQEGGVTQQAPKDAPPDLPPGPARPSRGRGRARQV